MRLRIKNFQSIEDVSLEITGLTIITGRNNIGKSAIIRAVEAALTGAPITNLIRHGQSCERSVKDAKTCKCFVSVSIEGNGFSLLWEKGDAINQYVLNGQKYTALERGMPPFLEDYFRPVRLGDESVIAQIANQFYPLFMLNKSSMAVADVFSDIAQLDDVNAAIKLLEKDRRAAESERQVRDSDLLAAQGRVSAFDGFDADRDLCLALLDRQGQILAELGNLAQLRQLSARARQVRDRLSGLTTVMGLCDVPAVSSGAWFWVLSEAKELGTRLSQHVYPRLPDMSPGGLSERLNSLDTLAGIRNSLKKPPPVPDIPTGLRPPSSDTLDSLLSVKSILTKHLALAGDLSITNSTIAESQSELAALEESLSLSPVCPECRRPL